MLDEEERMAHKPLASTDEDYPLYDSDDEEEEFEEAKRVGGWRYRWLLVKRHTSMVGDKLLFALKQAKPVPQPTQMPAREGRMGVPGAAAVSEKRFKAPKGKKIHVPVRVEPKVSFAAERTFLAWVSFPRLLPLEDLPSTNTLYSSSSQSSSAPSLPRCSTSAIVSHLPLLGLSRSSHLLRSSTPWVSISGA